MKVPEDMDVRCRECGPLTHVDVMIWTKKEPGLHNRALCPLCDAYAVVYREGRVTGPWFVPRALMGQEPRPGYYTGRDA